MKTKLFLILIPAVVMFTSCESDVCNQTLTYTKATAVYADMDELRSQELNSPAREIDDAGKIYVAEDYLLIGEEGKGIHVIDNSNPSNPAAVNFLNIPMTREFIVEGNKIYAESHYDLVEIDISNLTNAQIVNRERDFITAQLTNEKGEQLVGFNYQDVTETLPCDSQINTDVINYVAWNNELIPASFVPSSFAGSSSGEAGTINRIAKGNDHIYMITNNNLHVFDASAGLTKVQSFNNFSRGMETILIRDNEAFIGRTDGMSIVDISVAASPEITNEYFHQEACDPVLPHGDVAYVTLRADGPCRGRQNLLDVVDLSRGNNTSNLFAIERISMESPYGMTIDDNILYVGEGLNGLKAFDISNPRAPELMSWNQNVAAYDIIMHPTQDQVLLAGPNGLSIYKNNGATDFTLLSNLLY